MVEGTHTQESGWNLKRSWRAEIPVSRRAKRTGASRYFSSIGAVVRISHQPQRVARLLPRTLSVNDRFIVQMMVTLVRHAG
jgi:hypothetical protein